MPALPLLSAPSAGPEDFRLQDGESRRRQSGRRRPKQLASSIPLTRFSYGARGLIVMLLAHPEHAKRLSMGLGGPPKRFKAGGARKDEGREAHFRLSWRSCGLWQQGLTRGGTRASRRRGRSRPPSGTAAPRARVRSIRRASPAHHTLGIASSGAHNPSAFVGQPGNPPKRPVTTTFPERNTSPKTPQRHHRRSTSPLPSSTSTAFLSAPVIGRTNVDGRYRLAASFATSRSRRWSQSGHLSPARLSTGRT